MTLLQQLQTLRQHAKNPLTQFQAIEQYLIRNGHQNLYDEMTAPGILTYSMAQPWFTDYFINDENEGPKMKHRIQNELNQAEHDGYYWGQGDYNYGYDNTPTHFKRVTNQELSQALDELFKALADPKYSMYMRLAKA